MDPIEIGVLVVIMLGPVVLAWYAYRWAHRASDERRGRVQSNINGTGGERGAGSDGEIGGLSGGGSEIGGFDDFGGGGDGGDGGE